MGEADPRKYVLTGGPGCEKTVVLLALEQKGYPIVRSAAADWITLQQARGIAEPWKDHKFQREIYNLQIARETELRAAGYDEVVIDRGLIDSWVYSKRDGTRDEAFPSISPSRIMMVAPSKYDLVFLLEHKSTYLPTESRRETPKEALEIEGDLEEAYYSAGFDVIRVFADLPLDRRVEMIVNRIERFKRGELKGRGSPTPLPVRLEK